MYQVSPFIDRFLYIGPCLFPRSQSHYYLHFTDKGLMLTCSDSPKVIALVRGTAVPDPCFLVTCVAISWARSPRPAWHFLDLQLNSKFLQCLIPTQAGTWAAARTYSNSRLSPESNDPVDPRCPLQCLRVSSVKACGPGEGVHQLKVTVLEVILHVIPEIHSNTAVGLLDMVEPQSWQVQHLAGPHCAVKGLCLAVTGVLGQVWSQGVQWDPGYLETQRLPESRP